MEIMNMDHIWIKDYLFYYATYNLSVGLYSISNLELDSIVKKNF